MTTMTTAGYRLALPSGWLAVDVDPQTSPRKIRKLIEAAAARDDEIRANAQRMERLLLDMVRDADAAGVRSCACMYSDVDGVALQASLTIGVVDLGGAAAGAWDILGELTADDPGAVISIIELPTGTAVRRYKRGHQSIGGTGIEFVSWQFYLPVPGDATSLILMTCTSPNTQFEAELEGLFESVVSSFEFVSVP